MLSKQEQITGENIGRWENDFNIKSKAINDLISNFNDKIEYYGVFLINKDKTHVYYLIESKNKFLQI